MAFIRELRRRKVFQATGLYIVAAWVAVQVASLVFPALGIDESALLYVWLIVGALLPLVVLFSWSYDVSLDGISRTPPAVPGEHFDPSLRKTDIAIIVALGAVGIAVTLQLAGRIEAAPEQFDASIDPFSIAILPFDDMSGNADEQFFVSGMQSAVIDGLSRVRNLRVTAKVSTLPYRESGGALGEIAEQLKVARILEGTVFRSDGRVRIALRLHDAKLDEQVWAETFEDELENVLLLQARVAQDIANQVRVQLGPDERAQFAAARPVDPEAYLAFLRGVFHVERFNPDDMRIAATHFQRAVDIDPESALGYWGLGKLCAFQAQAGMLSPAEAKTQCFPPVYRALELDPLLPEAHMGLAAMTTWQSFDWESARPHWERALELNPSYAEAHMFYSHYLGIVGELEKSTYHIEQAVALDPLNPFVVGLHSIQLVMRDEFEEAIAVAEQSLQMAPGAAFGYITLTLANDTLDNEQAAIAAHADFFRFIGGQPQAADLLESVYAEQGYAAANLALGEQLAAVAQSTYVKPMLIGSLYEAAGRHDTAIDWYVRAYEQGDPDAPYLGVNIKDPEVRGNPRFQELLVRMDLNYWADRP
ncbi:MAG: hypothetical protein AAFX44_04720 [Pseudomonadota bacterium]